jgi:hypothetical protein
VLIGAVMFAGGLPAVAQDPVGAIPAPSPTNGPRALPEDLVPSLDDAAGIRPRIYEEGCHAQAGERKARACSFGPTDAPYSVLLIGDSHAAQWFPALETIAQREGWRLYSLTKSACPVPDTPIIVRGKRLRDCPPWRDDAFDLVAELHPDLVVAASLGRIYQMPHAEDPDRRERTWRSAWARSLAALKKGAEHVVLLGDTPMWDQEPIPCLRTHPADIDRCDTPRRDAFSTRTERAERGAAADAGVTYIPTADLVCPDDPCRAVDGRTLVLVDIQHMTVVWARSIADALLARLPCDAVPGNVPASSSHPSASASAIPFPSVAPGAATQIVAPSAVPSLAPGASPAVSCPG